MKNLHLIPSSNQTRLHYYEFEGELVLSSTPANWRNGKHIYVTSDEKIKEKDWVYNIVSKTKFKATKELIDLINDPNVILTTNKKIILTTDQDLIKDEVQAIDDDFLGWFVKNPSCKEVEVKSLLSNNGRASFGYKITIPKEEPKQDLEKEMFELEEQLDIPSHLRWHNSKPKQETLEEAADLWSIDANNVHPADSYIAKKGFLDGAKWQSEKMYSEEEVLIILDAFLTAMIKGEKTGLLEKWFEQFKKK